MGVTDSTGRLASTAGGQILRTATKLATARPAAKPLHPRGCLVGGTVRRWGGDGKTGAAWLDHAGEDDVLVRKSRALGMPPLAPDIFGLALRVPTTGDRYGDLLFASTGLGRLTRFTLTPARSLHSRPLTTLLPYRTRAGAVMLAAVFDDESRATLAWAARSGPWHRFAKLSLDYRAIGDGNTSVSFDPIRNTLSGLENYPWVQRLREPSYTSARRSRGP
jgi:hypothetical protein